MHAHDCTHEHTQVNKWIKNKNPQLWSTEQLFTSEKFIFSHKTISKLFNKHIQDNIFLSSDQIALSNIHKWVDFVGATILDWSLWGFVYKSSIPAQYREKFANDFEVRRHFLCNLSPWTRELVCFAVCERIRGSRKKSNFYWCSGSLSLSK